MSCFRINILSLDENTKPVSGLFPLREKKCHPIGDLLITKKKGTFPLERSGICSPRQACLSKRRHLNVLPDVM